MVIPSPRASIRSSPGVPTDWDDEEEHRRLLAERQREMSLGQLNNFGTVTFTASQRTTVVTDPRVSAASKIFFAPETQNAAGEVGFWVSSKGDGTFTITHANDARTDRTFSYIVIG